jgi:hypothetical protein
MLNRFSYSLGFVGYAPFLNWFLDSNFYFLVNGRHELFELPKFEFSSLLMAQKLIFIEINQTCLLKITGSQ